MSIGREIKLYWGRRTTSFRFYKRWQLVAGKKLFTQTLYISYSRLKPGIKRLRAGLNVTYMAAGLNKATIGLTLSNMAGTLAFCTISYKTLLYF